MKKLFFLLILVTFSSIAIGQKQWTLVECVDYALTNNLSVKQAEIGITFEEITKQQAMGTMLPSLNANASHGYNFGRTIDSFTNEFGSEKIQSNQFTAQSRVTIFNGFRLLNSYKQSEINIEKKKLELNNLQNNISLNVANAYLNILYNNEFLFIAKRNLEATTQQYNVIQKQVDAGSLPQGNLLEIESQKATDEASIINAENNLEMSYLTLKQLIQLDDDNFSIIKPDVSSLENLQIPISSQDVLINALENFPEIKVVEKEIESAEYGLKIAQGNQLPSLGLSYSIGTGYSGARKEGLDLEIVSFPVGTLPSSGEYIYSLPQEQYTNYAVQSFGDQFSENINQSLFLNLSVPIFNAWSAKGNIERAKLNTISVGYQMQEVKQNLKQEVEKSWLDAKAALKNYEAAKKTVEASEKSYEYAEIKYEQGVITLVEYNLSRTQLDNASAQLIRNKFDYIFKLKVLEFYQGKPIGNI